MVSLGWLKLLWFNAGTPERLWPHLEDVEHLRSGSSDGAVERDGVLYSPKRSLDNMSKKSRVWPGLGRGLIA